MRMSRVLDALASAIVSVGESTAPPPHSAFCHHYGLGRTFYGMPHTVRFWW
jgi:hypothetical protein